MNIFNIFIVPVFASILLLPCLAIAGDVKLSEATKSCIECHEMVHPGIVEDWKKSRHSKTTVDDALKKPELERRVSVEKNPSTISGIVVGCAECHTLDPEKHKDTFEHFGHKVHIVVSPNDCSKCHPQEVDQYGHNLMSKAHKNLTQNPVYKMLMDSANSPHSFKDGKLVAGVPHALTEEDSCIYCHGTKVEVHGTIKKDTALGEVEVPKLVGWPNGGVGRVNPDGSEGSCAACHTRHSFSIEVARKPATCSECHKGPDVPAYKVYEVSKHGNLYNSKGDSWNFDAVPWKVGEDFTAPTCATCHASLIVKPSGEVVAKRTHQMNDRAGWRLFGLIYSHPSPKNSDTTIIKNKAGLPLPTELTGEPAMEYLISKDEQEKRINAMKGICINCHSSQWADLHYAKLKNTIEYTNGMTLVSTQIMLKAWETGVAKGLAQKDSIFNEAIEKMWVEQWLFYANSTRFASAMGGADYGVFADGRWYLSKNLQIMHDWLNLHLSVKPQTKKKP